jgi:hypothetical protein
MVEGGEQEPRAPARSRSRGFVCTPPSAPPGHLPRRGRIWRGAVVERFAPASTSEPWAGSGFWSHAKIAKKSRCAAGDSSVRNPAARNDAREGKLRSPRCNLLASWREPIRRRRRAQGQHGLGARRVRRGRRERLGRIEYAIARTPPGSRKHPEGARPSPGHA